VLNRSCNVCDRVNPPTSKFCGKCGAALDGQAGGPVLDDRFGRGPERKRMPTTLKAIVFLGVVIVGMWIAARILMRMRM
jgi:hypothetical protein